MYVNQNEVYETIKSLKPVTTDGKLIKRAALMFFKDICINNPDLSSEQLCQIVQKQMEYCSYPEYGFKNPKVMYYAAGIIVLLLAGVAEDSDLNVICTCEL